MADHKKSHRTNFDITPVFDIVRMAQSWHEQLPDTYPLPDVMTRDDVRAEAAAFMQDGGQTPTGLDGLVALIKNNAIPVETYEKVENIEGKEKADYLRARSHAGMSAFSKDVSGNVTLMAVVENKCSEYNQIRTYAHEAAHIYLNHGMSEKQASGKQERDADRFACALNAREAFWQIDQNLKNGKLIQEGVSKFSLFSAMQALEDSDGHYSLSPQSIFMVRAAIDSVQKPKETSDDQI